MQKDIFDEMYEDFKFDNSRPVRVFETFAGIGFQRMALEQAGIEHESVGISEIDKFALQSYEAIHGETKNYGSITDIKGSDIPKQIDLFTYSFPCTDLSNAGQKKGMSQGTRSGLVYEVLRLLGELNELDNLPQVLIMENVTALINKRFINEFTSDIKQPLKELGYTNHVFKMNAREYGIPQNRDRVFMVSILGKYNFDVPKKVVLKKEVKDFLEKEVQSRYYISDSMVNYITANNKKWTGNNGKSLINKTIASTINTKEGGRRCDSSNYISKNFKDNHDLKEDVAKKDVVLEDLLVRKLTPRETGRLMGMKENQIDKQLSVVSNTQAYKQHGNGIVVDVFAKILEQMKREVK